MRLQNRKQAGMLLGERLLKLRLKEPLLLALPRGGVPVALEAARLLGAEMEILVVRKVGVPWHEELGMGAVSERGELWINQRTVAQLGCREEDVAHAVEKEKTEVERRVNLYRAGRHLPSLRGRSVVIVDDGIAMGVTARVACAFARAQGASQVILAAPVCSARAAEALRGEVSELVCLKEPEKFYAVGQYYEDFEQVSDDEVLALMEQARRPAGKA
jgi:putative phosphoribosyl transferase